MALVLLQESDVRACALPRARPFHPAYETQKHLAAPARRGTDHAFGPGVLRLESDGSRSIAQHESWITALGRHRSFSKFMKKTPWMSSRASRDLLFVCFQ